MARHGKPKSPPRPPITLERAQSLEQLLHRLPLDLQVDPELARGLEYLRSLTAWRLSEEVKAHRAEVNAALYARPDRKPLTGEGRGCPGKPKPRRKTRQGELP